MCDLWNQMYDSYNQIWVYWNQMCVKIIKYVSYESNLSLSKSNVRKKNQICDSDIKFEYIEIKCV